jgi:hypothetical protein
MPTPPPLLLTRAAFRQAVFARDEGLCVICKAAGQDVPGQDAHHILDRRLWKSPDEQGGYFVDNGATVCGPCHLRCESTEISVESVRRAAGIVQAVLPGHLYTDLDYDKWGNPILDDGRRLRGELADDESVRKVLATCPERIEWVDRIKYPRTWHLPWSPGATKDDRMLRDVEHFDFEEVVVTAKMDGENSSLYQTGLHARSLDYSPHESRTWIKSLWARVCGDIPEGWRICGENVFARHSIEYTDLESYFLMFSIWDGLRCLSWDDTVEWAALLDLSLVPVLYRGRWDEAVVRKLTSNIDFEHTEGIVVRVTRAFTYDEFGWCVAKWVRPGHVTTDSHWKSQRVVPNRLRRP